MAIDFLKAVFAAADSHPAIVWNDQPTSYASLLHDLGRQQQRLEQAGIQAGDVVALAGDFSPQAIAMLLAMIDQGCICVPMLRQTPQDTAKKMHHIAGSQWLIDIDTNDVVTVSRQQESPPRQALYDKVRQRNHPALVLFTSGSSGDPKAAVHDFTGLLEKFKTRRPTKSMLNFLMWDHWGGLNTLFHTLANGATLYTVPDRSPDAVCALIERWSIAVLPASPTFLNLLIISEAYRRFDLSSLELITYGSEPMPESTLHRLHGLFPNVRLHQTYGLIELGVFRSKSKASDSLWLKLEMEYRVCDGILQIKTPSAMLGYLNAASPFTEDGWFVTGDAVEQDGPYLRILGRKSEMINVGGEKVFPQEVENIIQQMDGVEDVLVYKEKNPITGNIVCASVSVIGEPNKRAFVREIKAFCRQRLAAYKVPVKITIATGDFMSARGKKRRHIDSASGDVAQQNNLGE